MTGRKCPFYDLTVGLTAGYFDFLPARGNRGVDLKASSNATLNMPPRNVTTLNHVGRCPGAFEHSCVTTEN